MRAEQYSYWVPAIAWATIILALSGDSASSGVTEGWLRKLLAGLGDDAVFYANYTFRKGAHVVAYGILGALNLRAIRGGRAGWRARWAVGAVVLAAVVAAIDEGRQATSASRTGGVGDVGFDLCGAALAQIMMRRFSSPEGPRKG